MAKGRSNEGVCSVRVEALEQITDRGQVWERMANKYGVANALPPWKSSLDGMCDALDRNGEVLPLEERRCEEDMLSEGVYPAMPYPESQLVALAHSLVARGVIEEEALVRRMEAVRRRLEAS